MPLDNYYTRPDFSRQIKQFSGTTATLSGATNILEKFSIKGIEVNTNGAIAGDSLQFDGSKFTPASQNSFSNTILNGLVLSYKSGLTYNVSAGQFRINNTVYVYNASSVTINSGHSTYNRFDLVYITSGNTALVLSGTPSAAPVVPSLSASTQLQIGIISVPALFTGGTGSTVIQTTSATVFDYFNSGTGIKRAGSFNAEASGQYSFAPSKDSRAYGENANAMGLGAIASGYSQTVVGQYNDPNLTDAFIVGNGTSSGSRTNAFRVTTGGSAYVTNKLFVTNIEIETTGASTNYGLFYDGSKFKPQSLTTASGFLPTSGGTLTGDLTIKQDKSLTIINSGNTSSGNYTASSITFQDNGLISTINIIPVHNYVGASGSSKIFLNPPNGNSYIPVGNVPSGADKLMVGNGTTGFDFIGKTDLPYLPNTGGTITGNSINFYDINTNTSINFQTQFAYTNNPTITLTDYKSGEIAVGPSSLVANRFLGTLNTTTDGYDFIQLSAGTNITINTTTAGDIYTINSTATGSGGGISGLTSAGTGNIHILSSITNNRLVYKTLSAGTNIGITESNGTIIISGSGGGTSGSFLPLSGGTVTGGTSFISGLTANTLYGDASNLTGVLSKTLLTRNIGVTNQVAQVGSFYLYDKLTLTSATSTLTVTGFSADTSISSYTPSIKFFANTAVTVTFRNSTTLKTEGGLDAIISGSTYDSITFTYNNDIGKYFQTNINNYI